jgi:hypothetical protein
MYSRIPYLVLLILTVVVLSIYLYQNRNESFESSINAPIVPIINLPTGDIHLIADNNPALIKTLILNYPLNTISTADNSKSLIYVSVFMHATFQYNNTTYTPLGQYIRVSNQPLDITDINSTLMGDIRSKQCLNYLCSSALFPVDYNLIWTSDIVPETGDIFSIWRPIAPSGCISLGDVIIAGTSKPARDYITCLPITMLSFSGLSNGILWHSKNDVGLDGYCWSAGNFDTFRSSNTYGSTMKELEMVYNFDKQVIESNLITKNTKKQSLEGVNGVKV